MKRNKKFVIKSASVAFILLVSFGCARWQDFTAYFNTYYNAQKLMEESEDEFEYHDEKKKINPRVLIVDAELIASEKPTMGPPPFMTEFIITQQKRQPVNIKLDSIIIKGSKLLATRPKSNFLQGTLYLMAKSFFYRNEWLSSQLKCSEMLDRYPDGDMSPDGHLLLAKNLLVQKKFFAGKIILSRTVDIAWQKKRYDILSEAFRLEAELALFEDDFEGALRPYRQAVSQADDKTLRAKWQLELACLYYRMGRFDRAAVEFDKVHDHSPDYLTRYEAELFKAASLMRIEKFDMADEILTKLEKDRKYEEWLNYAQVQRLHASRLKGDKKEIEASEKLADSAFSTNPMMIAYNYERGMDFYKASDYGNARKYFARARVARSPAFNSSQRMFFLLNSWDDRINFVQPELERYRRFQSEQEVKKDSVRFFPNIDLIGTGLDTVFTEKRDSAVKSNDNNIALKDANGVQKTVQNDDATAVGEQIQTEKGDISDLTAPPSNLNAGSEQRAVNDNDVLGVKQVQERLKADSANSGRRQPPDLVVSSTKDSLQAAIEQKVRELKQQQRPGKDTTRTSQQSRARPRADLSPKVFTDSSRFVLALALFELGRVHEQLKNHDSALHYYAISVDVAPDSYSQSSRFYHALARKSRDIDPFTADSLLEIMVERFPLTDYGRDAMKQLGYTDAFIIDSVAELYASGSQLRRHGDFNFAIRQFLKIFNNYPKSPFAPRALYAVGWTFERNLRMSDSAFYYYQLLIDNYPNSEYARDIQLTVTYYLALQSGEPLPDSLKKREVVPYSPAVAIPAPYEFDPALQQGNQKDLKQSKPEDGLQLKDLLDPKKLFQKAEEMITNPQEMLKQAELPSSPEDFFKKQEPPDSTGNNNQNIEIEEKEEEEIKEPKK